MVQKYSVLVYDSYPPVPQPDVLTDIHTFMDTFVPVFANAVPAVPWPDISGLILACTGTSHVYKFPLKVYSRVSPRTSKNVKNLSHSYTLTEMICVYREYIRIRIREYIWPWNWGLGMSIYYQRARHREKLSFDKSMSDSDRVTLFSVSGESQTQMPKVHNNPVIFTLQYYILSCPVILLKEMRNMISSWLAACFSFNNCFVTTPCQPFVTFNLW